GGRDAALNIINDTYEFDPQAAAGSRYTQKADQPGTFQNNVPGSAAAQGVLWVFGGGNPFADGPEAKVGIAAPTLARVAKPSSSFLAFVKSVFSRPKTPDTDNSGRFYDPSTDTWTNSTNMNPYPTTIVRYGFVQTATDFYVFGGVDNGSTTNAVNSYNIASGTWTSRAPMPFGGEAPTCALMESTGIVYCADGQTSNSFASYD